MWSFSSRSCADREEGVNEMASGKGLFGIVNLPLIFLIL